MRFLGGWLSDIGQRNNASAGSAVRINAIRS